MHEQLVHEPTAERQASGGCALGRETAQWAGNTVAGEGLWARLFDPGTFRQLVDATAPDTGQSPAGVAAGYGDVLGRRVYAYAVQGADARGGPGHIDWRRIADVLGLALSNGCPVVGVSGAARPGVADADAARGYGGIVDLSARASGIIPRLSVALGPLSGDAISLPVPADFVFVAGSSQQSSASAVSAPSPTPGRDAASFVCSDVSSCLGAVRRLLSYLPANSLDDPPSAEPRAAEAVNLKEVLTSGGGRAYDVRRVLAGVVDGGEVLELYETWGRSVVAGLARLGGGPVAVVASQPLHHDGLLDVGACDKMSRLVKLADAFNIPVITFVDTPGHVPGPVGGDGSVIAGGARVLHAYAGATVPRVSVILQRANDIAYLAMCSSSRGSDLILAWPTAEVVVSGAEICCRMLRRELVASAGYVSAREAQMLERYGEEFVSPYRAAAGGHAHRVIDPEDTREELMAALSGLAVGRGGRRRAIMTV